MIQTFALQLFMSSVGMPMSTFIFSRGKLIFEVSEADDTRLHMKQIILLCFRSDHIRVDITMFEKR